ncbi:MAG: OmpA family protein [Thiogranum sp.]|nr:OmpA family protein [Thiogranum sp.]
MLIASRRRRALDIWPGFVDALAALLMVVIFVLLLFSLGQFLLNDALIGRDAALSRLRGQMDSLSTLLAQTREEKQQLEERLQGVSGELQSVQATRDDLQAQVAALTLKAHNVELALAALQLELNTSRSELAEQQELNEQRVAEIAALESTRGDLQVKLESSREEASRARDASGELNRQLAALNEQITRLNSALAVSESSLKDKTLEVENLGARLNEALVDKVEELAAYRSEFFGKLHEALQDNPDVRIEGDRFLLPSEVLFPSASAELDERGQREIAKVAKSLKDIMAKIPPDMDWVLRVDGHTDRRPIRRVFPSNWELSSARATSIVKDLIAEGIPPEHLVAAGFAQYHPVDSGDTEEAYKRNRRIELKLTSR